MLPPCAVQKRWLVFPDLREGDKKRAGQRKRERVDGLLPLKMKEASLWVSFRGEGECYHSCAALV